jgi:hypothetical protein
MTGGSLTMLDGFKSLLVVLTLALLVFAFAKPICLKFMAESDFARRRMVWVILTAAAFLSPSLWIFAAVAFPLVYWAGRHDPHPTALYLIIFITVPFARVPIPLPLVNQLFELTPFRIFSIALLIPAAIRLIRSGQVNRPGLAKADLALIAFGLLQLALYVPYESLTNTARRAVLFVIDTWVLYYVFSRAAAERTALRDTVACYWLACAVLVPVVVFEAARSWLLYTNIPVRWGDPNTLSWLFRDGVLRAQGPAGHSLTMGVSLATAFGFWLYLGGHQSKRVLWMVGVAIWAALFATYSRAPWVVAAAILLAYVLLSPAGRRNIVGVSVGVAVAVAGLSTTSFGARIIATLPFIGTKEQDNVDYRQQVAEVSWRLIKQNPWFGDVFAARYMEELRQGQGIIDLVNTYASVAVFNGLVGATLFVVCFAYPALRSAITMRAARRVNQDDANLGAVLVASMLGILLMMATSSFGGAFEQLAWALAGLCSAYPAVVAVGAGVARADVHPAVTGGARIRHAAR